MRTKRFICLTLSVLLLLILASCFTPSVTPRENVTEDALVRNPEDTVIEHSVSEQKLRGTVEAICGEDMLRVKPASQHTELWGESVYIRTAEAAKCCTGDEVWVTFTTVERSTDPNEAPVIVSQKLSILEPVAKPVIYLYPETPTEVSVRLTLNGTLTCTYPDYVEGWETFTAYPDGTLIFPDGKEYYCLYWEGLQATEWDLSEGFCVKGENTAEFLEWALAAQGLTPREANEFILYWLPLMQDNAYNVISFQTEAYTNGAVLDVTPAPDCLIRVFMAWYPTDTAVEMIPQTFKPPVRNGFTVVEWGGSQTREP